MEEKTAGNIEVLKQQLDNISNLDKQITNLNKSLSILSNKFIELSQTQSINKQLDI